MYKLKQSKNLFALSAIAAGLMACGSAHAVITYYNLTQMDPDGTANNTLATTAPPINGAIFTSDPNNYPAGFGNIVGTGVIDPFLRIHRANANCAQNSPCPEYGYNTTGDGSQPQTPESFGTKEKEGHNWNHTLTLGSIGTVTRADGITYRVFALDINEPNANGQQNKDDFLLSLDQFRLFISDKADLDQYTCGAGLDCTSAADHTAPPTSSYNPNAHGFTDGLATKIYDLDTGLAGCATTFPTVGTGGTECDRTLALNSQLTHGSGNGVDMVVYVPDALFDPSKPYVYLFSSFGEMGKNDNQNNPAANLPSGDFGQAGGFEEWYTLKGTPIAPTLALVLVGLAAMGGMRRLRPSVRFA